MTLRPARPPRSPASLDGALEAYRRNLPRHLIAVAHDMQSRVLRQLVEHHGYRDLRLRFGPFLALLWSQERSVGELARELGVSKQACSQLASTIERSGYVERRDHPHDRRARLVRLTRRGRTLARRGARCIAEAEADYVEIVGRRRYHAFARGVAALYDVLDLPPLPRNEARLVGGTSAAVLNVVSEGVQRWLMEAAKQCGHRGLKMSHGQVLPFVGPTGGRIHAIARTQGVTRQAIHAVAKDLEGLGYLTRCPDPSDGRGTSLSLSPRGEALIRDSVAAVTRLDRRVVAAIGAGAFEQFRAVAAVLYEALRLEGDVFAPSDDMASLAARLHERLGRGEARRLASLLDRAAASQ